MLLQLTSKMITCRYQTTSSASPVKAQPASATPYVVPEGPHGELLLRLIRTLPQQLLRPGSASSPQENPQGWGLCCCSSPHKAQCNWPKSASVSQHHACLPLICVLHALGLGGSACCIRSLGKSALWLQPLHHHINVREFLHHQVLSATHHLRKRTAKATIHLPKDK